MALLFAVFDWDLGRALFALRRALRSFGFAQLASHSFPQQAKHRGLLGRQGLQLLALLAFGEVGSQDVNEYLRDMRRVFYDKGFP